MKQQVTSSVDFPSVPPSFQVEVFMQSTKIKDCHFILVFSIAYSYNFSSRIFLHQTRKRRKKRILACLSFPPFPPSGLEKSCTLFLSTFLVRLFCTKNTRRHTHPSAARILSFIFIKATFPLVYRHTRPRVYVIILDTPAHQSSVCLCPSSANNLAKQAQTRNKRKKQKQV